MNFEIIGSLRDVQAIAISKNIRELARLRREYGKGRWRKMKAIATIRYIDGRIREAELHWYEAHGIGRVDWKVKHKDQE
jgi:hypothetical protein